MASLLVPAADAPLPALPAVSDEGLAALAARGSQRAFSELYRRHRDGLYRYCHSILRQHEDAQDAVQTTMTRALMALERQDAPVSWRAWVFGIARNEAVDQLRRRRLHGALDGAEPVAGPSVEHRVEHRERLGALLADLEHVPERQRFALVLRELGGLSDVEIGAALGVSPSGVRQAVFEARAALKDFASGRELTCGSIRTAIADGDGRRLRGRQVRAHLRACSDCGGLVESSRGRRRISAPVAALPLWVQDLMARVLSSPASLEETLSRPPLAAKAVLAAITAATIAVGAGERPAGLHLPGRALNDRPPAAARPLVTPAVRVSTRPVRARPFLHDAHAPALTPPPPTHAPRASGRPTVVVHHASPAADTPLPGPAPTPAAPPERPLPPPAPQAQGSPRPASGVTPTQTPHRPQASAGEVSAQSPPPSAGGVAPGQGGTPPGQGGVPPGQAVRPSPSAAGGVPPGQLVRPSQPAAGGVPPRQAQRPAAKASPAPPGQAVRPPQSAARGVPPGQVQRPAANASPAPAAKPHAPQQPAGVSPTAQNPKPAKTTPRPPGNRA